MNSNQPPATPGRGRARIEAGSTGTGDARLTINGDSVKVWPNGAFLAWLRFPPDSVMAFVVTRRAMTAKVTPLRLVDLNAREIATLVPLVVLCFWIGVYPKPFADVMNPTIQELLRHVAITKLS